MFTAMGEHSPKLPCWLVYSIYWNAADRHCLPVQISFPSLARDVHADVASFQGSHCLCLQLDYVPAGLCPSLQVKRLFLSTTGC